MDQVVSKPTLLWGRPYSIYRRQAGQPSRGKGPTPENWDCRWWYWWTEVVPALRDTGGSYSIPNRRTGGYENLW